MSEDFDKQKDALGVFLFEILHKYKLHLIPDELVRVSALLLIKMLAAHTSFDMIKVVGLGSVWAWSFDEIVDDPQIPLSKKLTLIEQYSSIANSWDMNEEKAITQEQPTTSQLIIESLNLLIKKFPLTKLDKQFISTQFVNCLKGAEFETRYAGQSVDVEESLLHRGYSYATPFYGTMIFVGDYHAQAQDEIDRVTEFLRLFGRATRIRNDLSTYEKEKEGKEINIVKVLTQNGLPEQDALKMGEQYYNDAIDAYRNASVFVPPKFFSAIDSFRLVHDSAYEVKDIRTLNTENLLHI